jgi:hypothetical protein
VDLAKQKGITLITIPWWWDGTPERFFLPLSVEFCLFFVIMQQ